MLVMDGAERLVLANAGAVGRGRAPTRPASRPAPRCATSCACSPSAACSAPATRPCWPRTRWRRTAASSCCATSAPPTARACRRSTSLPLPGGGFAICSVDITALTRAEAAARARAALLERVLNAQRGGVALFDADAPPAAAQPRLSPPLRRHAPRCWPAARRCAEVMRSPDRAGEFRSTRARDHLRDIAGRRPPPAAHVRSASAPTAASCASPARPSPMAASWCESDDVTDLRRAEDEARRRAAILDGVLEALPHGICVCGPDHRVALFNAAYAPADGGRAAAGRRHAGGRHPPPRRAPANTARARSRR